MGRYTRHPRAGCARARCGLFWAERDCRVARERDDVAHVLFGPSRGAQFARTVTIPNRRLAGARLTYSDNRPPRDARGAAEPTGGRDGIRVARSHESHAP